MATFQAGLRSMRMIQSIFLFTVFLYPATAEYLHPQAVRLAPVLIYAFVLAAGSNIVIAMVLRQAWLGPAVEALRANAEDAAALVRWRKAQLVSLVMAESVCLIGFALRMIGAPLGRAVPFYVAAIFLMLIFRPADLQ